MSSSDAGILDDDDTIPSDTPAAEIVRHAAAQQSLGVVDWGATTAKGRKRHHNEDAWGHRADTWIVCDGMGGREGGELASSETVRVVLDRVESAAADRRRVDWPELLAAVNAEVIAVAHERGFDQTGSTLVLARVNGSQVTVVHVGDSRAYTFELSAAEDPLLQVLTEDHNVRSDLLNAGVRADTAAIGRPVAGLTSFIGMTSGPLRVGIVTTTVRAGTRLLLCSDGIHGQVDDHRLRACLRRTPCQAATDSLTAAADGRGGRDNATAVVLEFGRIEP